MKSKQNKSRIRNNYSKLKRKIFFQTALVILAATSALFLLRFIIQKVFNVGDDIVHILEYSFYMSETEALNFYRNDILNNIELFTFMLIAIFLVVLLVFTISRFGRYFDEVGTGMDRLSEESGDGIALSPELDFMEKKLNRIKSDLEKQRKAAIEAEQRKNDLVVYLAHDIKTPLTSVIGYLSLLDEAPDMPAEQKAKYVGITLDKAYRLEQLIDEFFEIARFNVQTIVMNKEKIDLPFMLEQMADEFYPMLAPREMRVSVDAPEGLTLLGDADKLARVFNNILKNAIAYSYKNSVIDISAKRRDEKIVISFTNRGNPIPKEKLDTIFEKFYRLDSSRSTNSGGAGLGLAIAKEIVTALGGTISAESGGETTIFTVKLPS